MAINYGSHSITTDNKITSGAIDITDGYNTLYFYSTDGDWYTAGNWYLDYDHTIAAGRIPTVEDIAIILNGLTSVSTGEIIAKEIIVRDSGYLNVGSGVYKSDVKFFNSTYIGAGQIAGNAIFYDTSLLSYGSNGESTPVITGHAIFNGSSTITGSVTNAYFGISVTFNDSSYPYSGGNVYAPKIILNSSNSCPASYYGDVDVTSSIGIGLSNTYMYRGTLTLYKSSYIGGYLTFYNNSRLVLKDDSYFSNNISITFSDNNELIIDTYNSTYASNITISGNDKLKIINNRNSYSSYGWIFGGGGNTITCGDLIFNNDSFYYGSNALTGVAKMIFNNNSYWNSGGALSAGVAPVKIVFNNESYNDGTAGDSYSLVEFNDSSYNDATIGGKAIFNDYSENRASCTVNGNAVFNDFSKNYGTIGASSADAVFNDFSINESGGEVNGNAYYYSASTQNGIDNASYYPTWA